MRERKQGRGDKIGVCVRLQISEDLAGGRKKSGSYGRWEGGGIRTDR